MVDKAFNKVKTIHQVIETVEESLKEVISSAINISVKTSKLECTRAQALASDFVTKNALVSLTIWRIVNPHEIVSFPEAGKYSEVHDFPSSYVLLRTLFEGCVNMYYVLIYPQTADEKELRLIMWDRHACYESAKMGEALKYKQYLIDKEKSQIEIFKERIKNLEMFNNLEEKEKQSLLDTHNFALNKLDARVKIAGIHESYYAYIYKLLSNYAHSGAFALRQIHEIKSPRMPKELTYLQMIFTEMFLSLTLKFFGEIFPKAQTIIAKNKRLLEIIEFWDSYKKKKLKVYSFNF